MSNWQPIETAQKEALEPVLLYGASEIYKEATVIGWWSSNHCNWLESGDGAQYFYPSHWMPLPQQPEAA